MKMKQYAAPLDDRGMARIRDVYRPMTQLPLTLSNCQNCMDTGFIRHAMRKKNGGGYYHVYKKCPRCNRQ